MTTDTPPICFFSASKAVTALLMHMLSEQGGLVNLMDPVSYYCPEFARNGKRTITVHQILSHRGGGIPPAIPPRETPPIDVLWDRDEIWRLLCAAKPVEVDGGAKVAYHAITGGFVLQRVLEKVTGDTIESYLDRYLRRPMGGMKWFTYGIAPEHLHELASNYATGPTPPRFPVSWVVNRALGGDIRTVEKVTNDPPRFQEAVIPPAGNLCGTAEEMGGASSR